MKTKEYVSHSIPQVRWWIDKIGVTILLLVAVVWCKESTVVDRPDGKNGQEQKKTDDKKWNDTAWVHSPAFYDNSTILAPLTVGSSSLSGTPKKYIAQKTPAGLYREFDELQKRVAMEVGYDEIMQKKVFTHIDSDIWTTQTIVETQLIDGRRYATVTIAPPPAPDGDGYLIKIGQEIYHIYTSPLIITLKWNPNNYRSLEVAATSLGFKGTNEQEMLECFTKNVYRKLIWPW